MSGLKQGRFLLLALTFMAVFQACEKESVTPEASVDEALAVYFERFETEGAKRRMEINLLASQVSGRLEDIEKDNVAGQCQHFENSPNVVLIDPDYWNKYSDLEKEYLIFHELGHCYLQRSHLDDKNADGSCVSMMQSGLDECRMNYNQSTREKYLDELFGL